jgi:hypothetical protein
MGTYELGSLSGAPKDTIVIVALTVEIPVSSVQLAMSVVARPGDTMDEILCKVVRRIVRLAGARVDVKTVDLLEAGSRPGAECCDASVLQEMLV